MQNWKSKNFYTNQKLVRVDNGSYDDNTSGLVGLKVMQLVLTVRPNNLVKFGDDTSKYWNL